MFSSKTIMKMKFKNSYELIKYLVINDRLKSYWFNYNDSSRTEITNPKIVSVLDDLIYIPYMAYFVDLLQDNSKSKSFNFNQVQGDIFIEEIRDYDSEDDEINLYPELLTILKELNLFNDDNDGGNFECEFDSNLFSLKKWYLDNKDCKEINVNENQKNKIIEYIKNNFEEKTTVLTEDDNLEFNTMYLSISEDETKYFFSACAQNILLQEFIEWVIEDGGFDDKSYEFEEKDLK